MAFIKYTQGSVKSLEKELTLNSVNSSIIIRNELGSVTLSVILKNEKSFINKILKSIRYLFTSSKKSYEIDNIYLNEDQIRDIIKTLVN